MGFDLRRSDYCDGDPGSAAASFDDRKHSRRELSAEGTPKGRIVARQGGGGRVATAFGSPGLRYAQNAPKSGAGLRSSRGHRKPFVRVQGGGIFNRRKGELQPALTLRKTGPVAIQDAAHDARGLPGDFRGPLNRLHAFSTVSEKRGRQVITHASHLKQIGGNL